MEQELNYQAKDSYKIISANEYIDNFREPDKFFECCRQCGSFNKRWSCPPFTLNYEEKMRNFKYVLLTATQIYPNEPDLPIKLSSKLIRPERWRLESSLRNLEKTESGLLFAYAGSCLYCGESECTRLNGEPCRHPDLARPSLEAVGFDIGKTLSDIFNITLLWGKDGKIPDYLTLVCGLFHNNPRLFVTL